MANKNFPKSGLPIRKTVELLPTIFQTPANDKFLSGVLDPLVQPGVLDKVVGYFGRRYGKTFSGNDVYLDNDDTLRSRYQLEPGVVYKQHGNVENYYDYIDFKNQLKFFGSNDDRDDKLTSQEHYSWNPPIDWDKFINYREYYWEPSGPPAVDIYGQSQSIVSTYKVRIGDTGNSFVFSPDSFTNNPTVTLYRGQTYRFKVDIPGEKFYIRTNYDSGSLLFKPNVFYYAGQLAVFDNKLWKAKVDVGPSDGSSITVDSQDWELIESLDTGTAFDYDNGVTNNGVETGELIFRVPNDAPDILYYQGQLDPNKFGRFLIADIESNSTIDVEKEIIGKVSYKSSNNIQLSNGMIIEFKGNVIPAKYKQGSWLVEGVGKSISLTNFTDLIVPVLTSDVPEVFFDNEGFDTLPFDDATAFPTYKDYVTIARNSKDSNPWSRYNRWFHRSVLEFAYAFSGRDFTASEQSRAKRPILEYSADLQLFNHGSTAKRTIDYLDDFTADVFSTIEGSTGYNIDGEFLFEGARILVIADTDSLANNKIYEVKFVKHNNDTRIHLSETSDSDSIINEGVLVRRGNKNGGLMYHFNGTNWVASQAKTKVNQPPLFDVFDKDGVSFGDPDTYPVSTFSGTKILSYKEGNGRVDTELGFALSYLNIDNVGDIQFEWNWDVESFAYTVERTLQTKKISTGFFKFNNDTDYANGWLKTDNTYIQPIIDSVIVENVTNSVTFDSIDWSTANEELLRYNLYVNGKRISSTVTRNKNIFTFSEQLKARDVVSIKIVSDTVPVNGYYEIPAGLEKNPFNQALSTFTLGQAVDHITSSLEFFTLFDGTLPGVSNLRDIDGYQKHAKRFLKHCGVTPLALTTLCDKKHNIIKSIQYSKKSYTEFKNNFLARAVEIDYNTNIVDFVDDIIASLTKTKNSQSPFADSDMIGSGAFSAINYTVEDTGIKTFSLTNRFSLTELSRKAVYVYRNGTQLLHKRDYEFNDTFSFVSLLINLEADDLIEIREYVSTAFNHIPPTPTSMGLYKKYTPQKFIDDTYVEPRLVIQGHDGSITTAYNDFRDDLLLELEFRIYNNIKTEYNPAIFDIDSIVSGYYGVGLYEKTQFDEIVNQEFLKWIQNTNINYTLNSYLDTQNSFTYTYSNMTDPTGTIGLPGYWRGVYKWFYDTDRPHRCPWEMLGFSEKPDWWESQYGPAPYTSNNLILWEDLRDGVIRQGSRAGRYERYKRSSILNHIPVDGDGNLLSPLDSALANDFSLINNKGPFKFGDIGPVEYAWRSSSEWPFAVVMAMTLLKPFEYITDHFNLAETELNILGQTINKKTQLFTTLEDINIPIEIDQLSVGLVKYLTAYVKSKGTGLAELQSKISNLDVQLSIRMSGFVDQARQKFLLDSKSPRSSSSSIFVPPENYDVIFNVSSPIASVAYSGVILEKTEGGWIINGYDDIQPYFNYFEAKPNQRDPIISVGGVSEEFLEWTASKIYNNGTLVRYSNNFYRALKTHDSGDSFDPTSWKKLADIPKIGAVEAAKRRVFNDISISKLSYGSKLTSIQQVVDFLLGYEHYLKSVGFTFNRYDPVNQVSQDWASSAKEFMFWTKHSWATGSLLTLSPAAQKIDITIPIGVADNILDGFYDYQVLTGNGKPLEPKFINVNRSFQNLTVETIDTTDGIYFLKVYYVLKEHVTVFDDRTVFNDIIYDKTTGYRQERIKTQGFRTVDWDGDYTSPGFLFDNVNIETWQPFKDYRLGDIVAYRSYNWTSLSNQIGSENFDDSKWSKLDTTPSKQLISNFDYKIKEFSDFYEVSTDGVSQSQRDLARHAIGYQKRDYLQNLSEDEITQFQLYQGFIREKGTANSILKVFGKLSRSGSDSIELNEEWAFRLGRLGGLDQIQEIEFRLDKNKFKINPQPIVIDEEVLSNQFYKLTADDFTVSLLPYNRNVNPVALDTDFDLTAGYVKTDQIQHAVKTRDDILNLDITTVAENDHIWVTFESASWSVYRVNESTTLYVTAVERTDDTEVTVTFNRPHNFNTDDILGFRNISNLLGFFKVVETTNTTLTVTVVADAEDPALDESTLNAVHILTKSRFAAYQDLDQSTAALLDRGSKVWIDNNGNNLWEVVEKQKTFTEKNISDYGISTPLRSGTKVLFDNNHKHVLSSIPESGFVMCYAETPSGLSLKQIISPQVGFRERVTGSFGRSMAISPDSRFLIIGSPLASDIASEYVGPWDPFASYAANNVVLYGGTLWKALNSVSGDGSTDFAVYTDNWEPCKNIPAYSSALGNTFYQQGVITIYEFSNGRYQISESFVSPRPSDSEKFGSDISVAFDGEKYIMAVSAVGAYSNTGRVYLYEYDGTEWIHIENSKYRGVYQPLQTYFAGDIVWQASTDPVEEGRKGNLWMNLDGSTSDGSTLTVESTNWIKVNEVSTQNSLPTTIAVDDDGSTLEFAYTGILTDNQLAEIVKPGDMFGHSIAFNGDGSVLIVGAPYSDGQYFSNYRGIWRPDVEYAEGDVVKFRDITTNDAYVYYRLVDNSLGDSTVRSFNQRPDDFGVWQEVSDSTNDPSGKIYVYKRTENGSYELSQMINNGSLSTFSDMESGIVITTGDQFGYAVDIDASGSTMVVSSPKSDINYQDQGSAYVFKRDNAVSLEYRLTQKLQSYEQYPNEYFGHSISISPDTSKIVVGARNTQTSLPVTLDLFRGTTFDLGRTRFVQPQGYTGGVYVFDKKDQTFILTEKLQTTLSPNESFGYSVDCVGPSVVVGSPDYREPSIHLTVTSFDGPYIGKTRLFKSSDISSWSTLAQQQPKVDSRLVKSIELYDTQNNVKIQDIDFVDPAKFKILNTAEKEIKFKTEYDPAIYTIGTDQTIVDSSTAWYEKNVGSLWWNIGNAKWLYYEQGDTSYRAGNWNVLAPGATIDVYEWIETTLLPSEWSALADTNEGTAEGISGQPLYPNDDVYSRKEFLNETTGVVSQTLYYYWVRNKTIVPKNKVGRSKSASEVASLINNPSGSGIAYICLIDSNKLLAFNFESIISGSTLLNIQYKKNLKELLPIHNEYQLLTEGVADSLPANKIETKWIDSLVGADSAGNKVPDSKLPAKQKYGIEFRPRQSMFVNRIPALKSAIIRVNDILKLEPFADLIDFRNLNLVDDFPAEVLNSYDVTVNTYEDLSAVGTVRIKQAVIRANVVDGELDTVDVLDPGFGYRVVPTVELEGAGTGASAEVTLDNQGRVAGVTVTSRGKRYGQISAKIRPFSVLVLNDSTSNNLWSVYAWDNVRRVFYRSQTQAFDTTKYWALIDWWKDGYSINSRIVKEINLVGEEEYLAGILIGDLIRVKEYASGGWAVFEKISNTGATFLEKYQLVAREKGTIEFSSSIYDTAVYGIGFDNTKSFDTGLYDIENSRELRNIFKAIKEDIFVGDYAVEWNKLFFSSIRYVFAEQQYVDWAFKTSFLNATHNVGSFEEKLNYKSDNLNSYQEYIDEVKPFRTTVREYVSRYNSIEPCGTAVADFDLPATYSKIDGKIIPIDQGREELSAYPWKWWSDNKGYSVVSIQLSDNGENYTTPPKVIVEGDGVGVEAIAYISNGRVSGINVLNSGSGYTYAPTISLVGGNPASSRSAKAVAIIGDSKVRTFDITVKFDRISKTGIYEDFEQTQQFTATGLTAVFDLNYAPTRDKSKISIRRNDRIVLPSEYVISLYYSSSDEYSLLRGKIIFNQAPAVGDNITVIYEKNDELLDAVNRINKYYSPTEGMKGKEVNQLMTGIDFGGVQIQGTTFEVTGGWDALPWFTDNWDSVESSADYYVVCDGSTNTITLPFVPSEGQQITIYIKRAGTVTQTTIDTFGPNTAPEVIVSPGDPGPATIRIDDPNYTDAWDSSVATNPNAQMPTFIGDGSTRVVDIGNYIQTFAGDILIFRPIESDGSVTITDPNLLDTRLSGGSLAAMSGAYTTATGTTAEEIMISGGKFSEPDHVPAPEENVPGQVLDSVSIKVYNSSTSGAAPLQSNVEVANGVKTVFEIGQNILENSSVLVYVNKVAKQITEHFNIDLENNTVTFLTAPAAGSVVEILSIGLGGLELIDYQEFIADGDTALFLTNANYNDTSTIYVTLNGVRVDAGFRNSTEIVDAVGKTLVEFALKPALNDIVKIVCLRSSLDVDSSGLAIVRVNQQTFEYEGSTRSYDLEDFVVLSRSSAASAMIVEVNGRVLQGVDTVYAEYDGTNNEFTLGTDPEESAGTILPSNVKVFVNNQLKNIIQEYVYNGTTKVLTIEPAVLNVGDVIRIENDFRAEFEIINNNLVIKDDVTLTSINETDNDIIKVIWFSEYPSMELVSDEYTGGKVNYRLPSVPLSASYVWVYKNGNRLTQDIDYYVSVPRGVVYLNQLTTVSDEIKIILFGSDIFRLPSAFEIHKDMLNIYHFNRFSKNSTKLAKDLTYYDTALEVTDASALTDPIISRNVPGVIWVNNERIEYLAKQGNILSQLRRGSQGTAIGALYTAGSDIVDVGYKEVIPYNESQERVDFVSDGSTLLIGPLDFVPSKSTRTSWTRVSIPTNYGPCDQIEVFAAGKRLRKDPIMIYDETLGAASPDSDKILEAEFAVDGSASYIRLTSVLPAGTRITVIRKTGRIWYERGETSASKGITLLENNTAIAEFIAQKTTSLPE